MHPSSCSKTATQLMCTNLNQQTIPKMRDRATLSTWYKLFYTLKPLIPRSIQLFLRRRLVLHRRSKFAHVWPIDESAGRPPIDWRGWPDNKKFALVLMHDVDTQAGHDKCRYLMDLEEELGFRSTFNFVPERYRLSTSLLDEVKARGFGLGVHGLKHDGKLFSSRELFLHRAEKINRYLADWEAKGFSSPSMLRNLDWMLDLNIEYGTSTFDTDPFEPQPDGIRKIFPYWVNNGNPQKSYLELPYTMPQDFTLFVLMGEKDTRIWENKLGWIAGKGGMALLLTHPDYMNFNGAKNLPEEYSAKMYAEFLKWVQTTYSDGYWHGLLCQIAEFYRSPGK